jgi:hypothetical protein
MFLSQCMLGVRVAGAVLGSALVLTGCSLDDKDDDKKDTGRKIDQTDLALDGHWQSNCLGLDWLGFAQSQESYSFSALGDFTKDTTVFKDDCTAAQAVITVKGTAASLGQAEGVADAKALNLTIVEATLTPRTEGVVTALNTAKYCGKEDWHLDESVDILGLDCAGESYAKGQTVFDIYRLQDNQLLFGKSTMIWFDATTVADRPTELDQERVFVKKS